MPFSNNESSFAAHHITFSLHLTAGTSGCHGRQIATSAPAPLLVLLRTAGTLLCLNSAFNPASVNDSQAQCDDDNRGIELLICFRSAGNMVVAEGEVVRLVQVTLRTFYEPKFAVVLDQLVRKEASVPPSPVRRKRAEAGFTNK